MGMSSLQQIEMTHAIIRNQIRQLGADEHGRHALRMLAEACVDALSRRSSMSELRRISDYALERERSVIDGKWDRVDTEELLPPPSKDLTPATPAEG